MQYCRGWQRQLWTRHCAFSQAERTLSSPLHPVSPKSFNVLESTTPSECLLPSTMSHPLSTSDSSKGSAIPQLLTGSTNNLVLVLVHKDSPSQHRTLSPIERLPSEILLKIISDVASDAPVRTLRLVSHVFNNMSVGVCYHTMELTDKVLSAHTQFSTYSQGYVLNMKHNTRHIKIAGPIDWSLAPWSNVLNNLENLQYVT